MARSRDGDPLIVYQFSIQFGDLKGFFMECGGLEAETEPVEHKVTLNGKSVIQMLPGRTKYANITLKRGITDNMDMWTWRGKVSDGNMKDARVTGSIVMYDYDGTEVARWNVDNAWPTKISGPQFKSDSNDIGVEEMTLVHEGLKRTK